MIFLRVGQTTAPINMKCEFCPYVSPPGETFYFQESDPILDDKNHDREFTTMCVACYNSIKEAAMKHKVPVEFDYDIRQDRGIRQSTNRKTKNF
jgi:hypothetical protein